MERHRGIFKTIVALAAIAWFGSARAENSSGYALNFDGTNSFVEVGHASALNAFPLTVTMWLNTTDRDPNSKLGVVNKYLASSFNGYSVTLVQGHIRAWYLRNSGSHIWGGGDGLDGGDVADGLWHHIAFTVDASGGRLYVDGALKTSLSWTGTAGPPTTTAPMRLGLYPGILGGFRSHFVGRLDEVQIWNAAHSQIQIQANMNRALSREEANLVAYYPFNEGIGRTTADGAPNLGGENTGELRNAVAWVTGGAPVDTTGSLTKSAAPVYTFALLAGTGGMSGAKDGFGNEAHFYSPFGAAVDETGKTYITDYENNTIRVITPGGFVTTIAGLAGSSGSADGDGSAARFYQPIGIAVDSAGFLYIADANNHTVRKITPAGSVNTIAGRAGTAGNSDGIGAAARFNRPRGLAVDHAQNLYVTDSGNCTIRKISAIGIVTTLAGSAGNFGTADGTGGAARFNNPIGICIDESENLYIADYLNHTIRKLSSDGMVTTLAGLAGTPGSADGLGTSARFNSPWGIASDPAGNVFVADRDNSTIRRVTPDGLVTTVGGIAGRIGAADGTGNAARFQTPRGLACDRKGNLYIADSGNNTIRKGTPRPLISFNADRGPTLSLNVPIGVRVQVEASVDLQQWETVSDQTTTESVVSLNEGPMPGQSARFYRARYFLL